MQILIKNKRDIEVDVQPWFEKASVFGAIALSATWRGPQRLGAQLLGEVHRSLAFSRFCNFPKALKAPLYCNYTKENYSKLYT